MVRFGPILPRSFYRRPTAEVARDLIGRVLAHGAVAGRIVETEAYLGAEDLASHAAKGPTPRARIMFGPPGYAYVYFIYGMYDCFNVVTEADGVAGAVLVRALEPLTGVETMRERRPKARRVEDLASGPGKLTAALGITRAENGADVTRGRLVLRQGDGAPPLVETTPRIGIRHCADWPLRFVASGSRFVSA